MKYIYECPVCGNRIDMDIANACPICPVCGFHDCGEWIVEEVKE